MLMRNDIAFIEAAYGAMRLGAYAVPVNWHFKPGEIDFDVPRDLIIGKRGLAAFAGKTK
jgi:acyl-CoA synthetase (AMP-forming)/AMP-acid ligase II